MISSLQEDTYGVVQQTLPAILMSMMSLSNVSSTQIICEEINDLLRLKKKKYLLTLALKYRPS